MRKISVELIDRFQELIYGQSSLRFSPSRLVNLESQIRERIAARGLSSYQDYFDLLQDDIAEFDVLIDSITTKETYFFRLPGQFRALGTKVVPLIEERLSQQTRRLMSEDTGGKPVKIPFRIWSAGCATGEEPYSIAMALMNGMRYPRAWQTEILASDISKEAITAASLGFYETEVIKKIPMLYQKKYVRAVSGGGVISDALVRMITFRTFNLRNLDFGYDYCVFKRLDNGAESMDVSKRFDIIFCRNVMIYFDFAAQQRLVDNLYKCLRPGGFLFTGDAELLHIYRHDFLTVEFEGTYFYQKPGPKNIK